MSPPINIDGTQVNGITIDGTNVSEVTVDGDVVFSAIPDSGISRLEFEQTLTDQWGGNDGTANGDPQYTTDSASKTYAREYDGNGDYDAFADFDPGSKFSVAFDFKPLSHSSFDRMFSLQYDSGVHKGFFFAEVNQTGNYTWGWQDQDGSRTDSDNVTFDTTLSTGSYYHVVCTYGGGDDGTVYVNGADETAASTNSWSNTGTNGNGGFEIGGASYDNSFGNAIFDDFRIYDKELTSTEVSNLYNTGSIDG